MAESIQVSVTLGLQQAMSQAEALRKILNESVKPDSSAYREIDNMLSKASKQAAMFKQTMGEALKTSSGTKTFTNNIQKTLDLLGVAASRLGAVRGNNLIFKDSDAQKIQTIEAQIVKIQEHIKELNKGKINGFFDDSAVAEFKQIQDLAAKLGVNLKNATFTDLKEAISQALTETNTSIDETTEKIKQLDNVLKNTNITDINKLTQGLKTQATTNTLEVFKADNLTEAYNRLRDFYNGFSEYTGKIKSKLKEGTSISSVIEAESKEINSVLSNRLSDLNAQKEKLQNAYNALSTIKIGTGQKKNEKLNIIQANQSILDEIGFTKITEGQNVDAYAKQARDFLHTVLEKVKLDEKDFEQTRVSMLDGIKFVFSGLDTDKVLNDAKGFKQSIMQWLSGEGINVKDNAIVQAFDFIKKNTDVTTVIDTIVSALQQYIQTTENVKKAEEQARLTQQNYATSLEQSGVIVEQATIKQRDAIDASHMTVEQLRQEIERIINTREQEQESLMGHRAAIDKERQGYEHLTTSLENYSAALIQSENRTRTLGNIRTAIANWMGFNQVLNLTRRAVSNAINHIKQLDTTMNGIAIVTNMTTEDLWKQVDAYSEIAQNYGVTIQGAYEVSKIYYQAGYETNEVLTLTNETLKLAKISGLDYATTTDYMMTAMRGFKLEMEDASRVVDVYSNLAANTAVSQQELAEAMTRTASSMESVGATFEETSAMIATMVAVTRESANNIGSAMKSIASRYGELTKDPTALFDAEGEAMSFNKVDEALRSVGITLQTTDHQFRDFTDVIIELAEKWNTLDSAQQRYIATQFAGNRQQSRFLALVSNVDLIKENLSNALNSEDIGTLQALETLDSLESKINQVQVAYQQFYTTIGIEDVWKGLLESTTNVINTLNGLPKVFDKVPVNAAAMVYTVITLIKSVALNLFAGVATELNQKFKEAGIQHGQSYKEGLDQSAEQASESFKNKVSNGIADSKTWLKTANIIGSLSVTIGALIDKTKEGGPAAAALATGLGGAAQAISGIALGAITHNWPSVIMQIASGVLNIFNGISIGYESTAEKLERLTKEAENLNNEAKKAKAEYNTLNRSIDKVNELKEKRNESIEATEEYHEAVNELADSFPQLIIGMDEAGNAIVEINDAEELLAELRRKTAQATYDAAVAERDRLKQDINTAAETGKGYLDNISTKILQENTSNNNILTSNGKSYSLSSDLYTNLSNAVLWGMAGTPLTASQRQQQIAIEFERRLNQGKINQKDYSINNASDLYERIRALNQYTDEDLKDTKVQDEFIALNEDIFKYLQQNDDAILESLYKQDSEWQLALKQVQTIREKNNRLPAATRYIINSQLATNDMLYDNSLLRGIITEGLYRQKFDVDSSEGQQLIKDYTTWYDNIIKEIPELDNIFKNLQNYSLNDIIKLLDIEKTDDAYQAVVDYYNRLTKDVSKQILDQGRWFGTAVTNGKFNSELGLSLITEASNLYADYEKRGLEQNAFNLQLAGIKLFNTLGSIADENTEEFVSLQQILAKGFSSKEVVETAIKTIQAGIDDGTYGVAAQSVVGLLQQMQSELIENYVASLNTSLNTNTDKYKNDIKTISKLSKGLSIDELYDFLTSSLNVLQYEAKDFTQDMSGAFKLSDTFMKEYWDAYIKENYEISDEIKSFTENVRIGKRGFVKTGNVTEKLARLKLNPNATDKEIDQAIDDYLKLYDVTQQQVDFLKKQITAELNASLGDYSEQIQQYKSIFVFANAKLDKNDIIGRETQKTLNDAYSSLISDVLSKGFENINLNDYTGLFNQGAGIQIDLDKNGSYLDFVNKYINYTGKTISEVNSLIVEAIQKDSEKTIDAAEVMKDVTFISKDIAYASLETAQKLADIFGKSITEIIDKNVYDTVLGGYKITDLSIFENIENSKEMVADSIQSFFETIADLIGKGLGGKLDRAGASNLISNLTQYGIQLTETDFFETAEGLQLSATAATRIYSELKNIDNIRARLVFDSLKDSLTKSGELCENLSSTLGEIARLEKELASVEKGSNKPLEDRLALYKEIAHSQALDPNQFKFMDRALPSGMQSPENYWNSVGKAYTAVRQAKTTGYMEIQDYYNIVTEMANMVELSGGQLEWMGITFENAAEMSATMIEQGMSALTNVKGDGVKISMAKLGSEFNIGVDDMAAGFEKGFHEMARTQIKMLDAQINFLEGVVALQELAGEDNFIDFNEVFATDEKGIRFAEDYVNKFVDIADQLKTIKVGDNNLYEVLTDYNIAMQQFQDHDQFLAFLNSFHDLWTSEDWDINTLPQKIKEIINNLASGEPINMELAPEVNESSTNQAAEQIKEKLQQVLSNINISTIFEGAKNITTGVGNFFSNLFKKDESKVTEETIKINLEYSETSSAGLQELIDNVTALMRTIHVNANGVDIPIELTDDFSLLTPKDGQYTLNTVDGSPITITVGTNVNETELSQVNGAQGTVSKIYTIDTMGNSILINVTGTDKDSLKAIALMPGANGGYTLHTENGTLSINGSINKITGLYSEGTGDSLVYKLKLDNNQEISLPAKINDQDVTGLRQNTETGEWELELADGQTILVSGSMSNVTKGWKDGKGGDPNKLVQGLNGSVIISSENIQTPSITITPTLDTSRMTSAYEEWFKNLPEYEQGILAGDLYGPPNPNLPKFNDNEFEQSEATQKNTAATNENTEKIQDNAQTLSKASDGIKISAKKFINAGNSLISVKNSSLRVVAAEERVIIATNSLVEAITNTSNSINNIIRNMAGYAPMTSGTTLTSSAVRNKPVIAKAKGNVALAAGRSTLMGELGPELWVSNGHYYVAGRNGAEFVNLPDDAIVFNHLQTQRLLANGASGRGTPVTNEYNAIAYAKGSLSGGPAQASAQAVLSQLKQIRAMWQSMLDASAKDLGSLAGGSGGGGGGGGKNWQQKTTTAEIQRWYNLIRQIAKLEKDISYEESLQSKIQSDRIANGRALYKSYKEELNLLKQEIIANQELATLQRSWYDAKRAELAASDYGKIFTYDENGLQQYTGTGAPGSGLGLDILENLTRRDVYGQAIENAATAQQQLEYLKSLNFNIENLKYNDDGTKIDLTGLKDEELDNAYVQMMENFWSNVDSWRDELDSIYDSYHEQLENVLSNQDKQNEIIQKIVDNQLAVENDVLKAIEEREQKRIDDAQDMRDALSDSTDKFINGLTDQLNREREMYDRNRDQDDLNRLRRQLAILTRSGGSASQIRSLQEQINSKSQEAYFNAQQEQIDSIKEASDAQLERLDEQIDIMTETLEYQKNNGLLWQEVYEVMVGTPQQIQDFIQYNTPDFQSNSALQVAEDLRELKLKIEQWVDYREDVKNGQDPINGNNGWDNYVTATTNSQLYRGVWSDDLAKRAQAEYNRVYAETSDPNRAAAAANAVLQGELNKKNASTNTATANTAPASTTTTTTKTSSSSSSSGNNNTTKTASSTSLLTIGSSGQPVLVLQGALRDYAINAAGGQYSNALALFPNMASLKLDGQYDSATAAAVKEFQKKMGLSVDGIFGPNTRKKLYGYSEGGLVDYSGLAVVHGSPDHPESFFNAAHTKLLKEDMLMREQLMPSLLSTYNNMVQNTSSRSLLNTINRNNGVTIDNVELKLEIKEMNNDYDARRAASTIIDELMTISRKSGNLSINRR